MKTQILIIDDDPVVRHLLGSILRAAGHEVAVAENGATAIALLKENASAGVLPRLIFLDLQLPDSTGVQLLPKIREIVAERDAAAAGAPCRPVSVAILTANSEAETKRLFPALSTECRPDFFLEKPFPPQRANEIVAQLLASETAQS